MRSASMLALGPLLFPLYTNYLPNRLSKSNARVFADDTTLFYSSNNPLDVQNTMYNKFQSLLDHCAANKLLLISQKTNYVEIIPALKTKLPICIGIFLDDNLSWSFQIHHKNNKLSKSLSIFYKLHLLLSLELLKQLYYSLFLSLLTIYTLFFL